MAFKIIYPDDRILQKDFLKCTLGYIILDRSYIPMGACFHVIWQAGPFY